MTISRRVPFSMQYPNSRQKIARQQLAQRHLQTQRNVFVVFVVAVLIIIPRPVFNKLVFQNQ